MKFNFFKSIMCCNIFMFATTTTTKTTGKPSFRQNDNTSSKNVSSKLNDNKKANLRFSFNLNF